ncbi:MAG: hypothetical protein HYW07_19430 [Candidatus Latescibacteria bacterium]|nr:hypothetical protein [Candidatus Latescibacterota bacterium]
MTTLTTLRLLLHLTWQTLRLSGRHFLPLFAIGGIPWAVFSLIPILLGQPQTLDDLKRAQIPITWDLLYPFLWAYLYALSSPWSTGHWSRPRPRPSRAGQCG